MFAYSEESTYQFYFSFFSSIFSLAVHHITALTCTVPTDLSSSFISLTTFGLLQLPDFIFLYVIYRIACTRYFFFYRYTVYYFICDCYYQLREKEKNTRVSLQKTILNVPKLITSTTDYKIKYNHKYFILNLRLTRWQILKLVKVSFRLWWFVQ